MNKKIYSPVKPHLSCIKMVLEELIKTTSACTHDDLVHLNVQKTKSFSNKAFCITSVAGWHSTIRNDTAI